MIDLIANRLRGREHSFFVLEFITVIHTFLMLILLLDFIFASWVTSLIRVAFMTLFLLTVPGGLLVTLIHRKQNGLLSFLLYAIGVSLTLSMYLGVFLSYSLPIFGIERPFSILPLYASWVIITGILSLFVDRTQSTVIQNNLRDVNIQPYQIFLKIRPSYWLIICLPPATALSVFILNRQGSNVPLLFMLIIISVAPLIILLSNLSYWGYVISLFSMGLSLLYHRSLWESGYPMEMWMPVITVNLGIWLPTIGSGVGHEGLLANSIIYPTFSILSGISPKTQLEVINPLIMALLPLAGFSIYQRYLDRHGAFVSATLLIFAHQYFFKTWPNGARDGISTLFLTLFVLVSFDQTLSQRARNIISIIFVSSVVFTHYGVSYILLGVLLFSLVATKILRSTDYLSELSNIQGENVSFRHLIVLGILIITWQRLTSGGSKSGLATARITDLFTARLFSGSSAKAVQYASPPSTTVSKALYIIFVLLAGIGLLFILSERYRNNRNKFHSQYMLMSAGFLCMLAASFSPLGKSFGAGRLIMISLPVISPLIYVAIRHFVLVSLKLFKYIAQSRDTKSKASIFSQSTMCILLSIFLLVNTGAVATVVEDDYGPSNIVSDPVLKSDDDPRIKWRASGCTLCDAYAVTWMVNNRNPEFTVYTDAVQKSVRYYGFTVTSNAKTDYASVFAENSSLKRENTKNLYTLSNKSTDKGYIRLHSANIRTGMIKPSRWNRKLVSINVVRDRLSSSNIIYSSGESRVYLMNYHQNSSIQGREKFSARTDTH